MNPLSIIISYHNEPRAFLMECISQLFSTIDLPEYEVVVVDDCSSKPLKPIDNVRIIRHEVNQGVGAAFDTGIANAKYENIMVMANDIRFIKNSWASLLVEEIEAHPKALTCVACVKLKENENKLDIQSQLDSGWFSLGATIKMFSDKSNTPTKSDAYRSTIDAVWLPVAKETLNKESYEIPCILGAAYGLEKSWYNYIDGWAGHMRWGTLEPMISLKSWLFGGSCRVAPKVHIGHIFKDVNPHGIGQSIILYNKYLVSNLLLPNPEKYIKWMKDKYPNATTDLWISKKQEWMREKRIEYAKKTEFSFEDFINKFNINNDLPQPLPILEVVKKPTGGYDQYNPLGDRFYDNEDYDNAIECYKKAMAGATGSQIADLQLQIGKSLYYQGKHQQSRLWVLQAILTNADFKEALMFMAQLTGPKNKQKWLQFAGMATNQDVLIQRDLSYIDVGLTQAREQDAKYYDDIFMTDPSNLRYQTIYKKIAEITGERRLLDIGCGSAKLAEHIKNYRGFDFIPNTIDKLKKKGLDVWHGNVLDKDNYKDADIYVSIEVLEHIENDLVVVGNIPIGKDVIISVPSFGGTGHVRVYTEQTLKERYKDLLDIQQVTYFVWKDSLWVESKELSTPFILFATGKRK